jgi:hypothetical protein
MAIAEFDMGQLFMYFLLLLLPLLLHYLVSSVSHLMPVDWHTLAKLFSQDPSSSQPPGKIATTLLSSWAWSM